MSIDKCTPGKWRSYSGTVLSEQRTIARCIGHTVDFTNEDINNAKLIASSKDMYEALEKISLFVEEGKYKVTTETLLSFLDQIISMSKEALPKL